jgi:multisubunit Na+/H+ antiporter MnhB subunit
MMTELSKQQITNNNAVPCILRLAVVLLITAMSVGLGYVMWSMPPVATGLSQAVETQMYQSGVSHPVTAVLLNFRGYDTLLEIVVLLLALMGVWTVGGMAHYRDDALRPVLDAMVRLLVPVLILVAAYLLWVGAQAPGGAFQAGSVLGAAGVLLLLAGWHPHFPFIALPLRTLLVIGPATFVAMAMLTLFTNGSLLTFPVTQAGVLILILEAAATLSIGVTLAALFLGGQPPDRQDK